MGIRSDSCSSSIDSSKNPCFSSESSIVTSRSKRDVSTDLSLGSISPTRSQEKQSNLRDRYLDWPPLTPFLRKTLAGIGINRDTFFVKVYMEGIPIGRKLDLLVHDGYKGLIRSLRLMFGVTILHPDYANVRSSEDHVLTYGDKDGDWMMVGDVPWEMFLVTVKRLKITRNDKCDSRELNYNPRRDLERVQTQRKEGRKSSIYVV